MIRSSSTLLSVLALSLAAGTFACSGASQDNADVESSKLAVQKNKDGKPTGNGTTCSWSGDTPVAPPPSTGAKPPGMGGGSSGGCSTDAKGTYRCWSYDSNGQRTDIALPSTSSSGGSSGSSGGCATDAQGNYRCWSYPSDPEPTPAPRPEPAPAPAPAPDAYKLGDWFPSIDGCNRCTCTDIGIMCTVQACDAPVPPPSKGCELDGHWFAAGERVPSGDCNSCSCDADGSVSCTTMGCPSPVPPSPPPAPPSPSPSR